MIQQHVYIIVPDERYLHSLLYNYRRFLSISSRRENASTGRCGKRGATAASEFIETKYRRFDGPMSIITNDNRKKNVLRGPVASLSRYDVKYCSSTYTQICYTLRSKLRGTLLRQIFRCNNIPANVSTEELRLCKQSIHV
jgi:hypothetical protein